MTSVRVPAPDELAMHSGFEDAAKECLRQAAVFDLVKRQVVSQGSGAGLRGISVWDLRQVVADRDTPVMDITEAELAEGEDKVRTALRGRER